MDSGIFVEQSARGAIVEDNRPKDNLSGSICPERRIPWRAATPSSVYARRG